MIELYQLEHLLAVARYGTLSKAAEELHLSQSSLSRSIQRLETDLQVPLFERKKNRITLNQNGELAVEYAENVMRQMQDMTSRIQAFDRKNRTISVGSCAPAPLWEISPLLSTLYPETPISSDMKHPSKLLQGLTDGTYQIIVMPYAPEKPEFYAQQYGTEQLFFSLPPGHPLSDRKELYLKDLDGETMLLYAHIGFWYDWHTKEMPLTHFLIQDERFTFNELVKASALPSFTSDIVIKKEGKPDNRIIIPIADPKAKVTYYCVCLSSAKNRFASFFKSLHR